MWKLQKRIRLHRRLFISVFTHMNISIEITNASSYKGTFTCMVLYLFSGIQEQNKSNTMTQSKGTYLEHCFCLLCKHRIKEWLRLKGTSGGHLVQP